jgi:uncharacterized protein (TIGR03435 family)
LILVSALYAVCVPAFPQVPVSSQAEHQFEAASIRMVDPYTEQEIYSGAGNNPWTFSPNRFTARRASLKLLIGIAYGVDGNRIEATADWMDSQHYSIEAKVDGDQSMTSRQMQPLIQRLLEERFQLKTHRNTKLVSGYALVVAKGGPKLQPGQEKPSTNGYILPNAIRSPSMSMAGLASMLSRPAGFPIIDKTGISGNYDIKLSYAPANNPDSSLPSLFTALQEQLGLKLEPAKVPVEYLVIDHAERIPTDN